MPREKSKWRPPRGERTDAEHRDGPTRTSDEGRSCGRSKGVGPSGCLQRPTGNRRRPWRQRSRRLLGGSGVSREAPAPFCERPEVKLLRPTRHSLHWVMDMVFRDDECRIRTDHAPANLYGVISVKALVRVVLPRCLFEGRPCPRLDLENAEAIGSAVRRLS